MQVFIAYSVVEVFLNEIQQADNYNYTSVILNDLWSFLLIFLWSI